MRRIIALLLVLALLMPSSPAVAGGGSIMMDPGQQSLPAGRHGAGVTTKEFRMLALSEVEGQALATRAIWMQKIDAIDKRLRAMRAQLDRAFPWRAPGRMPSVRPLKVFLPGTMEKWFSEILELHEILDASQDHLAESKLREPASLVNSLLVDLLDLVIIGQIGESAKLSDADNYSHHRLRQNKWFSPLVLQRLVRAIIDRDPRGVRSVYFQSISGGRFRAGAMGPRPKINPRFVRKFEGYEALAKPRLKTMLQEIRRHLTEENRWRKHFFPRSIDLVLYPSKVARVAEDLGLPVEETVGRIWPRVDLMRIYFLSNPQQKGGFDRPTRDAPFMKGAA